MKPVVLIERRWQGDAFRYSRYEGKGSTHVVECEPVKVGTPLITLDAHQVECLRTDPVRFLK